MESNRIGAVWIALGVGVLWLLQLWLGQETVAAIVATALGVAAILRDAWQIVNEPAQTEEIPGTRSTNRAGDTVAPKGKLARWLLGQ